MYDCHFSIEIAVKMFLKLSILAHNLGRLITVSHVLLLLKAHDKNHRVHDEVNNLIHNNRGN